MITTHSIFAEAAIIWGHSMRYRSPQSTGSQPTSVCVCRPLPVSRRLAAGAGAGMTATALTHPLDVVRLRLALPNSPYKGETPEPGTSEWENAGGSCGRSRWQRRGLLMVSIRAQASGTP